MKISTKRGDKGKTDTLSRKRISKADPEIEFLGSVDELQAWIGMCGSIDVEPREIIQKELYEIMAGYNVDPWFVTDMDHIGKFVLLSNNENIARTVCRRAERRAVEAECFYAVPYLNRLSDYLYKKSLENG